MPFGINDFYDHKRTYYFADLYEKLWERFVVEQVEFFGKWIGYICKNVDLKEGNKDLVNLKLVKSEEKVFYSI